MARKAPAEDPGDSRLRVGPPKDHAAGVPAVTSSLRHAHAQMGVRRSLLTLLSVNQKSGFDCPGCAWPEPEHATVPSSARTAPRRWQRRPPCAGSAPTLRRTHPGGAGRAR